MSTQNGHDESETTSLLASSSAPPDQSRPRPSLLHPYNPSNTPAPSQQESTSFPMSSRQTLTNTTLEEMERGAKRLADDNIGDSDSVNGLLAGMEASDDDASRFDDEVGDEDVPVSMTDLEFLAKRTSTASGDDASNNGAGEEIDSRKRADEISNRLLKAQDDPELEQRILRHSLKLSATPKEVLSAPSLPEDDEGLREQSFHEQSTYVARVHESTRALRASFSGGTSMRRVPSSGGGGRLPRPPSHPEIEPSFEEELENKRLPLLTLNLISMVALTLFVMLLLAAALALGTIAVGPPRQPMGEYKIVEAQVGNDFWQYYDFYAGKDSAGSNGYITYVSKDVATNDGIIDVITEVVPKKSMIDIYAEGDPRAMEDWLAEDMAFLDQLRRQEAGENATESGSAEGDDDDASESDGKEDGGSDGSSNSTSTEKDEKKKTQSDTTERLLRDIITDDTPPPKHEPFNPDTNTTTETFVMISSSPTPEGPRNSVRLEGRRRFNRGLFIIDLRHMPAGCGTWPAFWLTDEANWPVNGEIDIVEGVNYQNTAKTALHTTKECQMDDVPEGSKTGSWDTSVGIPNGKTGIPDMTFRWAQNCFVYDPHQWINQGCVATDLKLEGRSLGMPLNQNGGGVYALEWDPVYRHIRTWVFSPHGRVPGNLRDALRTAQDVDVSTRVAPDTNLWGLPYGHFPIGEGTNCPDAGHFRNMRLVINLAFCGSVAGNRYFMDCPAKLKKFKTCEQWVKSNPEELKEAYWKIRGVYVYERAWERQWS